MEATKEQIEGWKAKYNDVFEIKVDDKTCYLKKPDRKTLAFALTKANTAPLEFGEILINNCWLAGDEEIKTNDDLFLAVTTKLDALVQFKQAEIKKL